MCGKISVKSADWCEDFNTFKHICITQGFTQRGKAFFRIIGDGVLQVLKYTYESRLPHHEISLGLFSMYGELREQWFTADGCIPRYSVLNLIGESGVICGPAVDADSIYIPIKKRLISLEEQITILEKECMPILNQITTQTTLAETMCVLDIARSKRIIWNDSLKYAPFLCAGNYPKAAYVISAMLDQHSKALVSYKETLPDAEFQKRRTEIQENVIPLYEKLRIATEEDEHAVSAYTTENFYMNRTYSKFIRSSR